MVEKIERGKRIDRDKRIYLAKSGDDHASFASFDSYRYPSPDGTKCLVSSLNHVGSSASYLATRGATALSYGGGVILAQSVWRAIRHISRHRRPIVIPAAAVLAVV